MGRPILMVIWIQADQLKGRGLSFRGDDQLDDSFPIVGDHEGLGKEKIGQNSILSLERQGRRAKRHGDMGGTRHHLSPEHAVIIEKWHSLVAECRFEHGCPKQR